MNTQTFEQWMTRVDQILASSIGIESSDLPDIAYYDMWEDGVSARDAALEAFNQAREDGMGWF